MRGLGLLIFLIVAAIQIISAIAAKRKKEEERRMAMEAAERRRIMMETGISEVTTQSRPTPVSPSRTSADDVESRRRAQLEQLRQRREGKRQGAPIPPLAPPTARRGVLTPTLSPTQPSASSSHTMGSSDQARSRAMEAERRDREQERLRRQEQARAAAEREEVTQRAERAAYETQFHSAIGDSDVTHTRQTATTSISKPEPASVASAAAVAASLRARLRDPATLRELIVLQEVLHRPVGLR